MRNIEKMNIIYDRQYEAEAEYIKEFFNLIGLVITDICLSNEREFYNNEITNLLQKEENTVNIILNCYIESYYYPNNNSLINLYMYFDLKKGIICINDKPIRNKPHILRNGEQLFIFDYNSFKPIIINLNQYKREIRSKALDMLIEKIWKYDPITLFSIKNIKKNYIPENSNTDFFYTLQTTNCINMILNPNYLKIVLTNHKIYDFTLSLNDPYIIYTLNELIRMFSSLPDDSLYAMYAKTKIAITILDIYNILNDNDKTIFNIKFYNINELSTFIKFTKIHLKKHHFPGAYLFSSEDAVSFMNNPRINYPIPFYKFKFDSILTNEFSRELENRNYDSASNTFWHNLKYYKILEDIFTIIRRFPSSNSLIFLECKYSNYLLQSGLFIEANIVLSNSIKNFKNNRKLFDIFCVYLTRYSYSKMALNSDRELSAKSCIIDAYSSVVEFEKADIIRRIADINEKAFNDFIRFHSNSKYLYLLYKIIQPWTNSIIQDYEHQTLVNNRLSKFNYGDKIESSSKRGFLRQLIKYANNASDLTAYEQEENN